jgi:hypothetical protein
VLQQVTLSFKVEMLSSFSYRASHTHLWWYFERVNENLTLAGFSFTITKTHYRCVCERMCENKNAIRHTLYPVRPIDTSIHAC